MGRDLFNNVHTVKAISPQIPTGATVITSDTIDTRDYNSLMFVIILGTLAATTVTATVEVFDGNASNMSDEALVVAGELNGTLALAGFTQADDDKTRKIGYIGNKRYVRIKITPTSNNAALPISAVAILGNPKLVPTDNPPQ